MPYAQSPVILIHGITGGRRWWHFAWTETGVTPTSEWTVNAATARGPDGSIVPATQPPIPRDGTISLLRATLLESLTATTIAPKIGRAPNPTANTQDYIAGYYPAARSFNEAINVRFLLVGAQVLYGRSGPDQGSDSRVATELTIFEGHQ